ncbi:hypothetical protein SEA_SLOOPYJOE_66 [Arthrobacter phage Sloopyjoe]|nr:hypothetical protein PBI_STAYER_66 [Arthrobacter phage Stayer]QFG09771.1 hypothetical protein PBI_SHIBA_65 [Arthrobacter phage Shiba]QFG11777.1 hypothetical protein PBI_SALK_66 [Arthrobacter phage Salk]QFG12660.1 hypothetical protein PBI_MICHELLE_66 [Arthrobacter phage Michelle]QFG14433.1 hypothetical protein PBI_STARLORD_66 [Arthrobacter phage StarLord]UVT31142.1 hypothetical protein PBI_LINDA_66 [Arthrobacter phage Linda]WAB09482.1 hypothetical protein SEA_SLOOPYJOE_66 [Arthrobacter phag
MDRWIGIFFGAVTAAAVGLIVWCVVLVIQGPWYGTGTVVDKTYRGSYVSIMSCGKTTCPYTVPECYRLTVREYNGDEHTECVRPKFWEDTVVGKTVTLTKENS